jgi:hypothetical protein
MGPGCVAAFTQALNFEKDMPSDQKAMFHNFIVSPRTFAAPCIKRSPLSLGVQACNIPATNMMASCSANTKTYVEASPFTPKKTTVASLTFSSDSLAAVRV